jgi:tRNA dimethylallyltransferase
VVVGTHLYVKGFLEGLFEGPEPDPALRAELAGMDPGARRAELERVDPDAAGRIHPNDERRTVRALEIYRLTGRPISALQGQWDRGGRADCVLVGLEWPAEAINRRINARVRAMAEAGLVDEARRLWEAGRLGPTAKEALGYKQLAEHFAGVGTLDEAVERIKIETRRFAKNQRTWLRRLRAIPWALWIDASAIDPAEWAGMVVERCFGTNPG